jgi:tetratricopeptide (TPR) repeat protein
MVGSLLLPARVAADDESWTGQRIMVRQAGIRLVHSDESLRQIYGPTLTDVVYRVLKDQDGWLIVRHRGEEDWLYKEHAILVEDALSYFAERIRADDRDAFAFAHRGRAWLEDGEPERALKDLDEAIRLNPQTAAWFATRGQIYDELHEPERAIRDYTEALRLDPKDAQSYNNRGIAYKADGQYTRAIRDYDEVLRLDPNMSDAYFNRANAHKALREYDRAVRDYGEAVRLDPDFTDAYFNRASAYRALNEYTRAVRDYREVLRLEPEDADANSNLAWLLATCPEERVRDGKSAVQYATKACESTSWKGPYFLATLAAACAENGNFDDAIKWQNRALESPRYEEDEKDSAHRRLKLFAERKAYHEE